MSMERTFELHDAHVYIGGVLRQTNRQLWPSMAPTLRILYACLRIDDDFNIEQILSNISFSECLQCDRNQLSILSQ